MKKLLLLLIVLIALSGAVLLFKVNQFYHGINTASGKGKPTPIPEEKHAFNFLLMGYGGPNHDGAYLTDTIMIAHVDIKTKKIVLISVPRDIWVSVPTTSGQDFHAKINSVYQMGLYPKNYPDVKIDGDGQQAAADLAKTVIGGLIAQPIDNYLTIDFTGFKKAVDMLGGVDVKVEKTFDDYEYPIDGKEDDLCGKQPSDLPDLEKIATDSPTLAFPCRYEHLHFDAGLTHMDGERALKYVRSRHSLQDGTDFGRAARQQRLIEALREKVISFGFIPKIIPLMDELKSYIRTDMDLPIIQKFLGEADPKKNYDISTIVISNENYLKNSYSEVGGFILIPQAGPDNWSDVRTWVDNTIKGITPTPTKIASPSAAVKTKHVPID